MKLAAIIAAIVIVAVLFVPLVRFTNEIIAPLFLNSRIGRIGETNLPKIFVEGSTVYCRMKADDFRFPLPPGSRAEHPVVRGGFDTVEGSVEARFDGEPRTTMGNYQAFLMGKVPIRGNIDVKSIPNGLLIKFRYFGDR